MKRKLNSEQFHLGTHEEEEEEKNLSNHGLAWRRGPLIGKGAFGSVYLANLKNPNSKYGFFPQVMAIKSALVSASTSLQKEKQVFQHLHGCPFILHCYGEETTATNNGDLIYNVFLEFASGGTLASLIKQSGGNGLPELDVRRFTTCILKGIDFIHSQGFVHCDLKPDNVLFVPAKNGDSFVPKIGDFGMAKKFVNVKNKKMKFDPYFGGTALYMAPETVIDHIQEPPCDIWALGCIVFEMLTGKKVWDSDSDLKTEEILRKIYDRFGSPKIPSSISKDGKDFLKCCLVRNPKFRFTTEMLLIHPFVSGLDETEDIWTDSDDEFCESNCEDSNLVIEEGYPSSSCSNDIGNGFLDSAKPEFQVALR